MTGPIKLDIGEIPIFDLSREEVNSLLIELEHSFISHDNILAHHVVNRMIQFRDKHNELDKRDSPAT